MCLSHWKAQPCHVQSVIRGSCLRANWRDTDSHKLCHETDPSLLRITEVVCCVAQFGEISSHPICPSTWNPEAEMEGRIFISHYDVMLQSLTHSVRLGGLRTLGKLWEWEGQCSISLPSTLTFHINAASRISVLHLSLFNRFFFIMSSLFCAVFMFSLFTHAYTHCIRNVKANACTDSHSSMQEGTHRHQAKIQTYAPLYTRTNKHTLLYIHVDTNIWKRTHVYTHTYTNTQRYRHECPNTHTARQDA